MNKYKKALIVGPSWVGDMMMSQTLFILLKKQYPDLQIDVLAPAWSQALLARMPEVNESIEMPFAHGELNFIKRWQLGRQLAARNYDLSIVLPNSWKSAIVPLAARIKERRGYVGEFRLGLLNDVRKLDKNKLPLMVQRFAALALASDVALPQNLPYPHFSVDQQNVTQVLNKFNLTINKPVLALSPGAEFGSSKRWPEKYFASVANTKLKEGYAVWLFGSMKDVEIAKTINAATDNNCADLTGKTTLAEAVDLLSQVSKLLTNDSGMMHIAAALDKPIVVPFGSTSPGFTPPLSKRAQILSINLPCSPCFKRECPLKHHRCMEDLLPEKILEALAHD